MREISHPPKDIIESLCAVRKRKIKPFFDKKTQLDLNCLWVSALIHAHTIIPDAGYLDEAEKLFARVEKKFFDTNLYHSNNKSLAFLEDYAYSINCLIDLYDQTFNLKYSLKAKELSKKAIGEFYLKDKNIFQKNRLSTNDIFFKPVDISDHTIPNGNSIMLINFTRLGFTKEAKDLAQSLNGYLNSYKSFMISSIKSIDYFNEISAGNNCNEQGCKI